MDLPTTRNDQSQKSERQAVSPSSTSMLEKLSLYVLLITIFLAPLVFIPSVYAPLDTVKTVVIAIGILISCILYAISSLKSKKITYPRSALTYVSKGIILSLIISTLLSPSISKSFMGQGFEVGTASFLILMFISAFLITRLSSRNKGAGLKIYAVILVACTILALYHIARFLGGADLLSFGVLSSPVSTIAGKWYDFGILSAVAALISFFGLKFFSLGKPLKSVLAIALVAFGAILFIINFNIIWMILAFIFLCFGIYEYRTRAREGIGQGEGGLKKFFSRISPVTAIVFVIAIACMWKGPMLAGPLSHNLKVDQGELILPWQLTLDVASDTIKESPLFGAGPNRFGYQYLKFKPQEVNPTPFWNAEFTNGFGLLPSFVVSEGIVGLILWILFLIFFVREGVRGLRSSTDKLRRFSIATPFFIASFLWLIDILYVPSNATVFMTFIFTGLLISTLVSEGTVKEKEMPAANSSLRKIMPIVFIVITLVLCVWLITYIKNAAAIAYFQGGIKELNTTSNVDKAEAAFKKALSLNPSDVYYQAMSEMDIMKITALAQTLQAQATGKPDQAPDQKILDQIVALIQDANVYAVKAIAYDPTNYYNYIAQARIAELGSSFKFPNAYETAKASYVSALKYNPYNPLLYLNLARLEASQNKLSEALPYIGTALQLKPNYTEAAFLLSQIQVAGGQIKEAITSIKFAAQINPNEPLVWFQLGILEYTDKNYADAAASLEKAIALNTQYANARYFLGLSYARLGKNADAIAQFKEIEKTNPDNEEVKLILSNLIDGKSPFTDAKPPIDSKPESRKNLPVVDKPAAKKGVSESVSEDETADSSVGTTTGTAATTTPKKNN